RLNMDYKFANEEILQNWEPVPRIAILQLEIMLSGGSNTIIRGSVDLAKLCGETMWRNSSSILFYSL
ncbi:hypothetical protein, partial [Dehalobacterium formicoaceticum]|uniref:hypothetical protein n=1 Tax=Dehalobacterium formicoaceticum TaxID=51515 RepID=UPI0031F60CC7